MLFYRISQTQLPSEIPWNFVFSYYLTTISLFGLCFAVGKQVRLTGAEASIFAMSGSYSNVVLLGIPLVLASLGDAATIPLIVIISTHAAVMFLVTTLSLEASLSSRSTAGTSLIRLLTNTLKVLIQNQIVVGLLLGLLFNLLQLELPTILNSTASYLSDAALPCAVVSIGATISYYSISGNVRTISLALLFKNIMHPILTWLVCSQIFKLDPTWTATATILACCPTGINAYLFASKYNSLIAPTATVIVTTTVISIPVLGFAMYLLLTPLT